MRQPGIEPGPHRWQRRILTTELLALIFYIYVNNIYNKYYFYLILRAPRIELGIFCV